MRSLIWIATILIVVIALYQRLFRGTSYQRLGSRLGLRFDNDLPPSLDIKSATFFTPFDTVSNVLSGPYQNREVVVFDFHANHGDVGYKQTTVAIKSQASVESTSTLWRSSEIECQKIGEWIVMYRERKELPVAQIPEFLGTCKQLVEHFECN
jgi:hypothetical protein